MCVIEALAQLTLQGGNKIQEKKEAGTSDNLPGNIS